ncbi:monocarboxylate transporter 4 [Anabrus simplex]|uniref:monocarboxylate transporter 4 n=1 Tax=Anabrus simplex TaxID=316456 RepID=UPI0035A3165F
MYSRGNERCYSVEMMPGSQSASPSISPSPPPPPPAAVVPPRWHEMRRGPGLHRCNSAYSTRSATTLHSYVESVHRDGRPARAPGTPGTPRRPLQDDDDSCPVVLCERDMYSLHRNVPALRRRDVDTTTIRQHYYPEGGWGWIVCGAGFLVHLLTSGLQLAFGLLYVYALHHLGEPQSPMDAAWLGCLCLAVSLGTAPLVVALCHHKSTRLTAVLGGLVMALACLFTSFAEELHQVILSYGVVMGVGTGMVRETSSLMLGHYFKRRREFVEMVVQAGGGVGIALFSVLYKEAVGKWGWRLGLQAITAVLCLAFFLGTLYRSASMYHPQRRAILHLKNQRKKMKEKKTHLRIPKTPFFDLAPLRTRTVQMLLLSSATAALGLYTPIFYLALQGYKEGLDDSTLVLMQTFFGFATSLGCVGFGIVVVRPSEQCLISKQYLCQAAMVGIGVSLLALSTVQGYHGYVLFVWLYGVCLGGFLYSLKMFTMERVRTRHFTRAWSFVQGAEALPVLLGVPITGYINENHPKAGYYFSFLSTMVGAALLFLVGTRKRPPPDPPPIPAFAPIPNMCSCVPPSPAYFHRPRLHKSISFAHALDLPDVPPGWANQGVFPCNYVMDYELYGANRNGVHRTLRPTKSVPEGIGVEDYTWPRRQPRNVTVIEQITTSV